jgi:hypothetical protein
LRNESDTKFITPEKVEFARKAEKVLKHTSLAGAVTSLVAGSGLFYMMIDKGLEEKRQLEFQSPSVETAQTEAASTNSKITIVYEGQKEPRCAGDVERTVPQINKGGEVTGLTVYCKPEEVQPAK